LHEQRTTVLLSSSSTANDAVQYCFSQKLMTASRDRQRQLAFLFVTLCGEEETR